MKPDPELSANLYCAGRLEVVIRRVLVPLWQDLTATDPAAAHSLWFLRYTCRGEHIKLRFHGDARLQPRVRDLVSGYARTCFAKLEPAERAADDRHTPPMDREDRAPGVHPDLDLVWTTYERSPIIFGSKPLLSDDGYISRFTACLRAGCALALAAFVSPSGEPIPHRKRQTTLLTLIASGHAALFSPAERVAYAAYHRDWTVRHPFLARGARVEGVREIFSLFEQESSRLGTFVQDVLRRVVSIQENDRILAWQRSLRELRDYLEPFQGEPACWPDPFVEGPLFPSLLKLLNCLANQLGIGPLNEGLAHHIVWSALSGEPWNGRFSLLPGREERLLEAAG